MLYKLKWKLLVIMNLKTNKIMTEKEKAQELVNKFLQYTPVEFEYEYAIQCALIAVDEILSFIEDDRIGFNWKDYYKEVKQEIEKTNKI